MLRRRDLFKLAPSGLFVPGMLLPRRLLAAEPANNRKFLFIYCYGGWDTTMVYTPMFDNPNVDTESDATATSVNGINFVDSEARPSVRSFFETYGDRVCLVNGIEVRSVTHERCQRIMFTGSSESGLDDWPAIMAGRSTQALLLPHLVVAGPSFTNDYSSRVVRIGENGQLPTLLDGSALEMSTTTVRAPSSAADIAADAYLSARLEAFSSTAKAGRMRTFADRYAEALENVTALKDITGSIDLDPEAGGCARDIASDCATALSCFELGLSRCAITRDDGWCSVGWDTHVNNPIQSVHYEELFGFLNEVLADLDTRTSSTGAPLKDEVTIVVLSEMGRHPKMNSGGGRDHWTFTSCMLIGSGIQGGRTIGMLDDDALGYAVDLATGEEDDGGTALVPANLGATLLQLAGIDYAEYGTSLPLSAALEEP
jgi:uncharacterized protein (DUF1501 family)